MIMMTMDGSKYSELFSEMLNYTHPRENDSVKDWRQSQANSSKHTATCKLEGRIGNILYSICNCIAYALRYDMNYYIPTIAPHQYNGVNPFKIHNTGEYAGRNAWQYRENTIQLNKFGGKVLQGVYEPIPHYRSDINFTGHYQSFKYFDDKREGLLSILNLPYEFIDEVSIHVRRGDFTKLKGFDTLPMEYYTECINIMKDKGYNDFTIFSDDIDYCRMMFTRETCPDCNFRFIDGSNETALRDICHMASHAHNIVANSSFSFMASWLNKNENKVVLCPGADYVWYNTEYIPEYFKVVSV